MRRIPVWLIKNSIVQTYTVLLVCVLTFLRNYFIDKHIRQSEDIYTPIVYSILILWVYYSIFFRVRENETFDEKVIFQSKFDEPNDYLLKFINLSLLLFMGSNSFFIFGRLGVIASLCLITISGMLCIFMIGKNSWKNRGSHKVQTPSISNFLIFSGIVGYFYFISWKSSYCHEFGVNEIGNFFEKDTYQAKYMVEISRANGGNTYKLPANILISRDFSDYESYDIETGIGPYINETTETSEIRYAKVNTVLFNNGGFLYFKDCLVSIDEAEECTCLDQDGEEWSIEMTLEKAK